MIAIDDKHARPLSLGPKEDLSEPSDEEEGCIPDDEEEATLEDEVAIPSTDLPVPPPPPPPVSPQPVVFAPRFVPVVASSMAAVSSAVAAFGSTPNRPPLAPHQVLSGAIPGHFMPVSFIGGAPVCLTPGALYPMAAPMGPVVMEPVPSAAPMLAPPMLAPPMLASPPHPLRAPPRVPPRPPPPPPVARPSPRGPFFCEVCERSLWSADRLEMHLVEDHVDCDFEECDWNGPPALLHTHKITHIRDSSGVPVASSPTETEAWVVARRRVRCRKRGLNDAAILPPVGPSELERYLRDHLSGKRARTGYDVPAAGGVVPHHSQYIRAFETKRNEAMGGPDPRRGDGCRLWQEFDICESFLRTRRCQFGSECRRSHDVKKYQEWQVNRIKTGMQLKLKSVSNVALIYKLHHKEIAEYEALLLATLQALSSHNFFLHA